MPGEWLVSDRLQSIKEELKGLEPFSGYVWPLVRAAEKALEEGDVEAAEWLALIAEIRASYARHRAETSRRGRRF
ncbi:hypothetical protein [Aeropyrum camini]|uniref:Rhs family protein n=1 Tax=Aeropyrum camini SY1 = JCM 12091 TaxID=1198449 RepID=U3TC49_9CREN|nr:hypothetical protein [Aeropyrum camini]BAN89528.1 rhs family protein [Aeropyrum camini SY1 = JCM 12091]